MIQEFDSRDVYQDQPIEMTVFADPGQRTVFSTIVKRSAYYPQILNLIFVPTMIWLPDNLRERVKIESIQSTWSCDGIVEKKSSSDEALTVRHVCVPDGGELRLYISYPADPGQQSEIKPVLGTVFIRGYWTNPKPWDFPVQHGGAIPSKQDPPPSTPPPSTPQTECNHEAEFIEWANEGILIIQATARFVRRARKIRFGWLLRQK